MAKYGIKGIIGGGAPKGTQEAGALFRSRDVGETWERLEIGDTPPSRMARIAIDGIFPAHIYCCAMHGPRVGPLHGMPLA
jgi:hypothetical protein